MPEKASPAALLAAGITVALWASAFVGVRSAGQDLSPGPLALIRLVIGSVVLGAILAARRPPLPRPRDLPAIAACGVLWFGGYNVALNAAEQRIDAGTAAMLIGIGPIVVAVIAGVVLREGFPRTLVLGTLVAFAGVLVIGVSIGGHGRANAIGVLFCLAAALAYACAVVIQKPILARVSALQITWLACTAGAVACLPFAPTLVHELGTARPTAIGWSVYLGVLPTAVAFTTWAYALARTSAGRLGTTTYLAPPIAIGLGWLLLHETPPPIAFVGGALCLVGVGVSRLRTRAERPPAEPPVPVAAIAVGSRPSQLPASRRAKDGVRSRPR